MGGANRKGFNRGFRQNDGDSVSVFPSFYVFVSFMLNFCIFSQNDGDPVSVSPSFSVATLRLDYKTIENLIQDLYQFVEKGHKLTDFMRKSL